MGSEYAARILKKIFCRQKKIKFKFKTYNASNITFLHCLLQLNTFICTYFDKVVTPPFNNFSVAPMALSKVRSKTFMISMAANHIYTYFSILNKIRCEPMKLLLKLFNSCKTDCL